MNVQCLVNNTFHAEVLTKATNFFSRKLRFQRSNIDVIITPAPGAINEYTSGAFVVEAERGLMVVALDTDIDLTLQVQYLAHELVHVKQLLCGALVLDRPRRSKITRYFWKGEDLTHLPYHARPWEREAMRQEVVLTYDLLGAMGLSQG